MTEQNRAYADLAVSLRAAADSVPVKHRHHLQPGLGVSVTADTARWIADQLDRLRALCDTDLLGIVDDCPFCLPGGLDDHDAACPWWLAKQSFQVER